MAPTDTPKLFTAPEAWTGGGSYSLLLYLVDDDDRRLALARETLWSFPGLEGCWLRNDVEPSPEKRLTSLRGVRLGRELFGLARVPGGAVSACASVLHREEVGASLGLLLPFGALGAALPIGAFPEDDGGDLAWRPGLDAWCCALAEQVHRVVPCRLGLVGWPDGQSSPLPLGGEPVPEERWIGYLLPEGGGLAWHPPNRGAPIPAWSDGDGD